METIRDSLLPWAQQLPGMRGAIALVDRSTGKGYTITFWESEEALRASEAAADEIREKTAAALSGTITNVDRCDVTLFEMLDV